MPLTVASHDGRIILIYKDTLGNGALLTAHSTDGIRFSIKERPVTLKKSLLNERIDLCDNFRLSSVHDTLFLSYEKRSAKNTQTIFAKLSARSAFTGPRSKNGIAFTVQATAKALSQSGLLVHARKQHVEQSAKKSNDHSYTLYYSNTSITAATSDDLVSWKKTHAELISPRAGFFDHGHISIISAEMTAHGVAVLYQSVSDKVYVGAALFSPTDPLRLLWRSESPLWETTFDIKLDAHTAKPHIFGAIIKGDQILLYVNEHKDSSNPFIVIPLYNIFKTIRRQRVRAIPSVKRHENNPIISPNPDLLWETQGTFNPAVIYLDGKAHILYRALGDTGLSVIGYASSTDGVTINYRSPTPIYVPRERFEGSHTPPKGFSTSYSSGGGWGGCEDPKITMIDNKIYLTYVANDGYSSLRGAMSHISVKDFLAHKWHKWSKPRLITEPKVVNKSICILPKKINGKYVFFHRVFPHIYIDYVDSIDELGRMRKGRPTRWLRKQEKIPIRPAMWDSRKISVGATPIETKKGWLVVYHAVDDRDDGKYQMGLMLLDKKDVSKVLHRTNEPVLSPEMDYENDWKPGIVYPTGAAVIDGILYIYYGGGDKTVCVASAPLDQVLTELEKHDTVHLEPKRAIFEV